MFASKPLAPYGAAARFAPFFSMQNLSPRRGFGQLMIPIPMADAMGYLLSPYWLKPGAIDCRRFATPLTA